MDGSYSPIGPFTARLGRSGSLPYPGADVSTPAWPPARPRCAASVLCCWPRRWPASSSPGWSSRIAGLTGFTARQVADGIENLPAELEVGAIPHTSKVFDANGNQIARFYTENREDVRAQRRRADDAQGDRGDRGLPVLRARRDRHRGHQPRAGQQPARQRHPGRLEHHPAADQADPDREGRHQGRAMAAATEQSYTRKIRELQYAMAYEQNHSKNADPRGLPQHRLLRRRRLRHQDRRPALLLGQPGQALAGAVRAAGRAGAEPDPVQPDRVRRPRARAAQRRAAADGRPRDRHRQQRGHAPRASPLGLRPQRLQQRLRDQPRAVLLRLRAQLPAHRPGARARPGASASSRCETGGLTIHTTVDLRFQRAADQRRARTASTPPTWPSAAWRWSCPAPARCKALAQSRPMGNNVKIGQTYLNFVVPKEYGDANGFQGGSTFKVFTLGERAQAGPAADHELPRAVALLRPCGHAARTATATTRSAAGACRTPPAARRDLHDVHRHPAVGELLLRPAGDS